MASAASIAPINPFVSMRPRASIILPPVQVKDLPYHNLAREAGLRWWRRRARFGEDYGNCAWADWKNSPRGRRAAEGYGFQELGESPAGKFCTRRWGDVAFQLGRRIAAGLTPSFSGVPGRPTSALRWALASSGSRWLTGCTRSMSRCWARSSTAAQYWAC